MKNKVFQVIVTFFLAGFFLSSPIYSQQNDYGQTSFLTSGSESAQEPFLRGLLMLHSFEYEDAREAFQEAKRIEPDFAMAYWGEAMTHNHPVWLRQDTKAGQEVLMELGSTLEARLAKAPTEREKDYLRTLDVLFFHGGSKEDRDDAYSKAMAKLATQYPDDLDAATFHALSILGTSHEGRDFATYMRAASIGEVVFAKNPQHPGAAHYLIHSYDDVVHAPLGLRPAQVYSKIAPASAHALHMPSHIYFALGMWDEGSALNLRSYNAAKTRADRKNILLDTHGHHALQWLPYSYLQQGKYEAARDLLDLAWQYYEKEGKEFTFLYTRSYYLLETEQWQDDVVDLSVGDQVGSKKALIMNDFIQGLRAVKMGNAEAAKGKLISIEGNLSEMKGASGDQQGAQILKLELQALLHLQNGNGRDAEALMQEATSIENDMPLDFGPPWPLKPAHEFYGEMLLGLNKPTQAQVQFKEALKRYPNRARSLVGLTRSAIANGDAAASESALFELKKIWQNADAGPLAILNELEQAVPEK